MTHTKTLIAATVLLALAACGQATQSRTTDPAPETLAGCDRLAEAPTEELFVLKKFTCTTGRTRTWVYTFNDTAARDRWRDIAEQVGAVTLATGDRWIQVKV